MLSTPTCVRALLADAAPLEPPGATISLRISREGAKRGDVSWVELGDKVLTVFADTDGANVDFPLSDWENLEGPNIRHIIDARFKATPHPPLLEIHTSASASLWKLFASRDGLPLGALGKQLYIYRSP